jgi:hypothetical protein
MPFLPTLSPPIRLRLLPRSECQFHRPRNTSADNGEELLTGQNRYGDLSRYQ